MRARKLTAALAAVPLLLASAAGVALADDLTNNLDNTIDNPKERMPLTVGGGTGQTGIRVVTNDQGNDTVGCNLAGGKTLTVSVASSAPGIATVSPHQLTFTQCDVAQPVTVTPVSAGSTDITFTVVENATTAPGSFNMLAARFEAVVSPSAAPADGTAPAITPHLTGTLGERDWYTSNVGLSWSVIDNESSVSSSNGCGAVSITQDQDATDYTCTATSAGGTATKTVSIKRDATAPVIEPADVTVNTWSKDDVSRSFSASDATSGLANSTDASFTLTASLESVGPASPTTATKTITDAAGNSTTRTLSALIDKSGPEVIGGDVTASGWRNTPLSANFTAEDSLSGLLEASDAAFTLGVSAESLNATTPTTDSKTVYDRVGNPTTRTVSAFIDVTAPGVAVNGVTAGATYVAGDVPTATCHTTDGLSGVRSEAALTQVSGPNGSVTATCSGAEDNAGNTQAAAASVTYRVLAMGGYNKNFDGTGVPKAKAGSAIPLAWAFTAGSDVVSPLTRVAITSVALSTCTDEAGTAGTEVAEVAAGSSGLQLLSDGSYQVNWKSATTATGCRRVTVKMYTGPTEADLFASRSANFNFTK
jgi:hypothetical protein